MSRNILLEQTPTTATSAKNSGWKTTQQSAIKDGGCDVKQIEKIVIQGVSFYKCKKISTSTAPDKSQTTTGTTVTSTGTTTGSTTTTTGGSTPAPKKKTSPYKRCENKPLQTKYCVSELIKKVQICLKEAGHDLGNSGVQRDGVDGYWGDKTDAALRTYGFGSGIDKQAVEVICSTVDRIKRERVQKQLKDKADQEYQQKYGGMERAAEVDYLYFGGENAGGGDEEASGEGMEGETLFFN